MAQGLGESVRRWLRDDEHGLLLALYALLAAIVVLLRLHEQVPALLLVFPLLLATLFLSPRRTTWLAVAVALVLGVETLYGYGTDPPLRRVIALVAVGLMCLVVGVVAQRRVALGVAGNRSDAILTDLRTRLSRQGRMPSLPPGWYSDVAIRSAGGTSFSGDFLVTSRSLTDDRLDLALVDVSGKGVEAGPKSLLLSGAFSALLSSVLPSKFLVRANNFVVEQDWDEGFATAVHLSVHLDDGTFRLWSAGHPPAVHFRRGSGTWSTYEGREGPALGLVRSARYPVVESRLQPGDALMVFTDGLIERSGRDMSIGLDHLLGESERLLLTGFEGCAAPLVDKLGSAGDDCALVVLHRLG